MIPSESIKIDDDNAGTLQLINQVKTVSTGKHCKMFVENMKSWNRMHDPLADAAVDFGIPYLLDKYAVTSTDLWQDFAQGVAQSDSTKIQEKLIS